MKPRLKNVAFLIKDNLLFSNIMLQLYYNLKKVLKKIQRYCKIMIELNGGEDE